jgi:membrane protein YqaA with SNARE-associated domain
VNSKGEPPEGQSKFAKITQKLQSFIDRFWYPPLISLLAALDNFFFFIPTDGFLVSSTLMFPKRWFYYATIVTIGSIIGASTLIYFIDLKGLPWVLQMFPGVDQTTMWSITMEFFEKYGLLVVFIISMTPLLQQPAVILATVSDTAIWKLLIVVFFGRYIKYLVIAYIASYAPKLLTKMWGMKKELKDAGAKID